MAPDTSAAGVGAGNRVVVVGGGAAGLTAVQTLRESIPTTAAANYEQDQRLIAMYSLGIQKRELL